LTEVNEPHDSNNGDDGGGDHGGNGDEQSVAAVAPSVAVLLVCTADLIMKGLHDPVRVDLSAVSGAGLDVEVATHADLQRWAQVLGLRRWPWSSQPYVNGGTLCQLTNIYGRWRDARVRLHCLEPVDALPALRGEQEQP